MMFAPVIEFFPDEPDSFFILAFDRKSEVFIYLERVVFGTYLISDSFKTCAFEIFHKEEEQLCADAELSKLIFQVHFHARHKTVSAYFGIRQAREFAAGLCYKTVIREMLHAVAVRIRPSSAPCIQICFQLICIHFSISILLEMRSSAVSVRALADMSYFFFSRNALSAPVMDGCSGVGA